MKIDEKTRVKLLTKIEDLNRTGIYNNITIIGEYYSEDGEDRREEYLIYLDEKFYLVNCLGYINWMEEIDEDRAIEEYFNTIDFDEEVWEEFTNNI